jgi:hypothetical protein
VRIRSRVSQAYNLTKSTCTADRLLKVEEENRILRTTLNSALEDLNRRVAQVSLLIDLLGVAQPVSYTG